MVDSRLFIQQSTLSNLTGYDPAKQVATAETSKLFDNLERLEILTNISEQPTWEKIIYLVQKKQKSKMELSKELGIAYNNAFKHIAKLLQAGVIKEEKVISANGQTNLISLTNMDISKTIKDLQKENRKLLKKIVLEIEKNNP